MGAESRLPSAGLSISYSSARHSAHIRNLTFSTGTTNAGAALALTNSVLMGSTPVTDIINVLFRGDDGGNATDYWTYGTYVSGVSNVNWINDLFFGPLAGTEGTGIFVQGSSSASPYYGIIYTVQQCSFLATGWGVTYGSYIQGVTVNQSQFTNGLIGIYQPTGNTGVASQLTVSNSQFNTQQYQIYIGTGIGEAIITGNVFFDAEHYSGIYFNDDDGFTVYGNTFGYAGTANTGQDGIVVITTNASQPAVITGNTFLGQAVGILLGSASTGVNVQSNAYVNNTTNVTNSGSSACPASSSGNCVGGGSD